MVSVLGRAAELATIAAFLADPRRPSGRLVLRGLAGMGKSVLWEHGVAAARADPERVVLATRASESEVDLPLVTLTDLLGPVPERVVRDLPGPQRDAIDAALLRRRPTGGHDPRTLGTAVLSVLDRLAGERPVLLAIDDAQWVDGASAAALDFAFRRLVDQPIAVLAAARTADDGSDSAFSRALTRPPGGAILEVGPVSLALLHHLVLERVGSALTRVQLARLAAESGGNPLLALELAGALARLERWPLPGEPMPLPADTGALLRQRIGREAPAVGQVLLLAAVLPAPTTSSVTAGGTIGPAAAARAIDGAVGAGLLAVEPNGRLRFPHPLIASAALAAVPSEERRRIHARLAERASTIEERGRHTALAAIDPSDEVSATLAAAAVAARDRGATGMAADWMERAAALTPSGANEAWAARITRAAAWRADSGEIDRARSMLEAAIPAIARGDRRAEAMLHLAQIVGWAEGAAAVVAACRDALAEAVAPNLRARLRLRIASEVELLGAAGALAEIDAALADLADRAGPGKDPDPDLLACALLQRASLRLAAGIGIDHDAVARAIGLLAPEPRRTPDGDEPAESLRAHALVWQWWSDLDEHERARERQSADLQRDLERGHERPTPIGAADLAVTELWLGDMAAAERHASDAQAYAEQTGGSAQNRSVALGARAAIAAVRGDLDDAEAAALAGLALVEDDWLAGRHLAALGLIALTRRRPDEAILRLGPLFDRLVVTGQVETACTRMIGDLLEAAAANGELARVRAVVAELETRARTVPRAWVAANLARGRALLAAADGDVESAAAAAGDALRHAEALRMPFELARIALLAGRLDRRRKARRSASIHLDRARAGFAGLGAARWVDIADAELARIGRRAPATDALTETEDAVARLAARGLTNREVGEAAFLTPKSVEGVLARVYGKLGIRSRAELGAWLKDQPGGEPSSERDSPV